MKIYVNLLILFIAVFLPFCSSKEPQKKEAVKPVLKKTEERKTPPVSNENTPVKNEVTFNVPQEFQVKMGLKTEAISKNSDGNYLIPKSSIEKFNGRSAIFISMGDSKFGLIFGLEKHQRRNCSTVS